MTGTDQRFLTTGWVNTLMAGTSRARSTRGRYSSAGYVRAQEELYIADVPAGSRRDELRDWNRRGYAYQSERPWHDTPEPPLEQAPAPRKRAAAAGASRLTLIDRMLSCFRREKRDAIFCGVLLTVLLTMGAFYGQKMIEGVRIQREIERFQASTRVFEQDNERLTQALELAMDGERIRNLAQNRLHMLRPERAETETIYIQTADSNRRQALQQDEEPKMELLDILLGLLNVLNIGE